jgi:hypothetical protein
MDISENRVDSFTHPYNKTTLKNKNMFGKKSHNFAHGGPFPGYTGRLQATITRTF